MAGNGLLASKQAFTRHTATTYPIQWLVFTLLAIEPRETMHERYPCPFVIIQHPTGLVAPLHQTQTGLGAHVLVGATGAGLVRSQY